MRWTERVGAWAAAGATVIPMAVTPTSALRLTTVRKPMRPSCAVVTAASAADVEDPVDAAPTVIAHVE